MQILYVHASKYGNGEKVAAEFARQMAQRYVDVTIRHVRDVKANRLMDADLYVFSSPGRMGKPPRRVRRFLANVQLPVGTRCAILATELAAQPNKKTGLIPTDEELARWRQVVPIMHELLATKGLVSVEEATVQVTAVKGPLEPDWEQKVADLVAKLPCPTPIAIPDPDRAQPERR